MLPSLGKILTSHPRISRGGSYTLLDLGTSSGGGANFIGEIFGSFLSGYRIQVTALDNMAQLRAFNKSYNEHVVDFLVKDVFLESVDKYDFIVCSHVLEHMDRKTSIALVEKILQIAKYGAIFYVPFDEKARIFGHEQSIKWDLLDQFSRKVDFAEVIPSLGWMDSEGKNLCLLFYFMNNVD